MPNAERRTAVPSAAKKAVYEDAYVPRSKPAKYRCEMCDEPFTKNETQIDHIIAWADGGTHERGNLRILCSDGKASCHRRVTRKQSKNRQRAPKSRAHFTGRLILGLLTVALIAAATYAAAQLAGDTDTTTSLARLYKTTGVVLVAFVGAWVLLKAACARRKPATVETVSIDVARVEAWIAKAIPDAKVKVEPGTVNAPKITVKYPPHTPSHDGGFRTDILERAEDLYPKARIEPQWLTEKDTFILQDIPDPLDQTIDALPISTIEKEANYGSVDMGKREDGSRWRLQLIGNHVLLAGATGAGKSASGGWGIVRGLAPGIRDGLVVFHTIDPKGGVEMGQAVDLFETFSDGSEVKGAEVVPLDAKLPPTQMDAHLAVLNKATGALEKRLKKMRGDKIRKVEKPSVEYPLHVVFIDEAAFLLAYASDPKAKKAAQNALEYLTSQGRAAGFCVICLVQDPSADTVKIRNLLPTRIALRLDTPVEVRMVLGDGARGMGARADRIKRSMPGTGYMLTDKDNRPVRFRAPYVSDEEIAQLVRDYAPKPISLAK